ncbi:MAG: hypothetical protein ABSH22_01330 [Tepidisphaeraceae bacterium]
MATPSPIFMDVRTLLESSRPRARVAWLGATLTLGLIAVVGIALLGDRNPDSQGSMEAVSTVIIVTLVGCMTAANYLNARARRREQARIEAAEELVQLRRWPQAALLLQSILSQPTYTPLARLQALVYFSSVLARFHRFEDVIVIDEHLLETMPLDEAAVHMVKLARATALLREDRLFDADRAISDLRHSGPAAQSGGLALLEMYRDVKTGHPTEALDTFAKRYELIRQQLGHRLSDAHVLAAKAHDLLNQTDQAKAAYQTATLLAPAVELHRRYPETMDLARKFPAHPAPAEVIG